MKEFDITILTDARYVNPKPVNNYVRNIILEDQLVVKALAERGINSHRVDWADSNYDWSATNVALFRSTWDYFERIDEFMDWLNKVKETVPFINPIELVIWNLDKHYLQELTAAGINIPDTIFIEQGNKTSLNEVIKNSGWADAILKPAVSGAARHTYRLAKNNLAAHETIFQTLIAKEAMLLQSFQQSVLTRGEVALIYFNGKYSHAVLKVAKPGDFRVQDDFGGTVHNYTPTVDEIKLGEKTLQACDPMPIYARVDIIEDNDGMPAVSELELIEPELWFRFSPGAAQHMADAIFSYITI